VYTYDVRSASVIATDEISISIKIELIFIYHTSDFQQFKKVPTILTARFTMIFPATQKG